MKNKIIAYYLPQYHPIPENDEWWGKGFTEWTTVGKAKPLFRNHYQPRVPADLGYYDLRIPEVREKQAVLAKEAGIYGFCYWHYWFGNGKQLLEMPFNEVLKSGSPDFPFCLGWANESWKAKVWDSSAEKEDKVLIEQIYPGEKDVINHFLSCKKAFADNRYIKNEGKPIFLIYKPLLYNDIRSFIAIWNRLIKEYGIATKFYFIANISSVDEKKRCLELGFDAVTYNPICRMMKEYEKRGWLKKQFYRLYQHFTSRPLRTFDYSKVSKLFFDEEDTDENVIPFILPNWDHSPRSGRYSIVLQNSTPKLFGAHVKKVLQGISNKKNKLIFLKSWNEWGEGNYMEPDLRYGKGYIDTLGKIVKEYE